jgi:hypothetical protein
MKSKDEILKYLNGCQNCFVTNSKLEIHLIKYKRAFEDIIILGVSNSDMKSFDCTTNRNISVVAWKQIEGYQLKGYRILKEDEHEYCNQIEEFKNGLKDANIELSKISLVLCYINDIYNVTPGKFAGKIVE